jgi:aspartate-semialdehyde dehydrogenase
MKKTVAVIGATGVAGQQFLAALYMLVSHNTKMGAAKGAILVAEYLARQGHI